MSFYYGAHMSCSNIINSLKTIKELGGNFIQIFVDNPKGVYNKNLISKYDQLSSNIVKYLNDNNMKIVIHAPYTLNFAREIDYNSNKFKTILDELVVAHKINAIGCVIHVGKKLDLDEDDATTNMFISLKYIIKFIKDNNLSSKLILETAAGQGTEMFVSDNNSLENFANFYHMFSTDEKNYIKLCLDTCHVHSAGFDISSRKKAKIFFNQVDKILGVNNVALIHFNDSLTPYNSHADRHASIGHGTIGVKALSEILKQAYKRNIPCVLETKNDTYTTEVPWMNKMHEHFEKKLKNI